MESPAISVKNSSGHDAEHLLIGSHPYSFRRIPINDGTVLDRFSVTFILFLFIFILLNPGS